MNWKNTSAGYGSPAIALHWLMLLLLVAVYASMELKGIYPKGSAPRAAMASWHYMLGLSVCLLVCLRLLLRLTGAAPVIRPAPPAWQNALAGLVQWTLYALMLGLPLLGWLTLSAKGVPIPFFGAELPALLGKNEGLTKLFKEIHETAATAGYFLIGLHAAAALFHHHIKGDNTLRLMWPAR